MGLFEQMGAAINPYPEKEIQTKGLDDIPFGKIYIDYLNIASLRFNLTLDECRDRYGLYTNAQWMELFNQPQN